MRRLARLLGCTEGQLYTALLALALIVWLAPATVTALRNGPATATHPAIPFEHVGTAPPDALAVIATAQLALGQPPLPPGTIAAAYDGHQTVRGALLRLAGDAAVLWMETGPGSVEPPGVRLDLCPAYAIWFARQDGSPAVTPRYDCTRAAHGQPGAGGSWSFDLGAFADRAGPDGFALVPAAGAQPGPFQVTLVAGGATPRP